MESEYLGLAVVRDIFAYSRVVAVRPERTVYMSNYRGRTNLTIWDNKKIIKEEWTSLYRWSTENLVVQYSKSYLI